MIMKNRLKILYLKTFKRKRYRILEKRAYGIELLNRIANEYIVGRFEAFMRRADLIIGGNELIKNVLAKNEEDYNREDKVREFERELRRIKNIN